MCWWSNALRGLVYLELLLLLLLLLLLTPGGRGLKTGNSLLVHEIGIHGTGIHQKSKTPGKNLS